MKQESVSNVDSHATKGALGRYTAKDITIRQGKGEEDADLHLAQKITQNKQFSISGQADDEYDFDDGPRRKRNKRSGGPEQVRDKSSIGKQVLTQQERCQYCFENPNRPKHLVVSIGNFTYLMLPPSQPLVQGHCCILTLQHESATRNVDDNVWGEIRNFKKCLILMFANQQKDVVFLETVIGLSQQRRHCLVECIPLPRDLAGDAQLYFKKPPRRCNASHLHHGITFGFMIPLQARCKSRNKSHHPFTNDDDWSNNQKAATSAGAAIPRPSLWPMAKGCLIDKRCYNIRYIRHNRWIIQKHFEKKSRNILPSCSEPCRVMANS